MKIAFPVQLNEGMDSRVYTHFGSAPFFVIVDTDTDTLDSMDNTDFHHQRGRCQPLKALGGNIVDAVVVGGIGGGALRKLQAAGIKVFRALDGSVRENIEVMKSGSLPQFLMNMTCAGHSVSGGCAH